MFEFKLNRNPELEKYRNWMNDWIYRIQKEMANGKLVNIKIGDTVWSFDRPGSVLINPDYVSQKGNYFTQKPNLGDVKLEKFWMCLVEGSSTSSYKHSSERSAKIEAERLSRQLDKKVFILEATDYVELQKPVVWKKTQELPF